MTVGKTEPPNEEFVYFQLLLRKHACRMRYILHRIDQPTFNVQEVRSNIEYAASLLETVCADNQRRMETTDGADDSLAELLELQDTMPADIKDWLESTFTSHQGNRTRRGFRAVAFAIKIGIKFDRMFRKAEWPMAPIPNDLRPILAKVDDWTFNPFTLNEASDNHALKYVGYELFNRMGLLSQFKINWQSLELYLLALEAGYSKHNNPYHNLVHGADVAQTSAWILTQTGFLNAITTLECFAVVFAALIHDYEHTGHTNNFHVQTRSQLAFLYNDRSVLENHHVSSCFRLLIQQDRNILIMLNKLQYREFRNLVIEIVLATDMSTHFAQIKQMKNMLSLPDVIDKNKAMGLVVHACDISHPTKPFELHNRWTQCVLSEFFAQGDTEASMGLPYSPLCDRTAVQVPESQIGFIDFIVEPTMVVVSEMLIKMVEPLVAIPSNVTFSLADKRTSSVDTTADDFSPCSDASVTNESGFSDGRVPLTSSGKLDIPMPWIKILAANKAAWKALAKEAAAKKKAEAEAAAAAAENETEEKS